MVTHVGDKDITAITDADLQAFFTWLRESYVPSAPITINPASTPSINIPRSPPPITGAPPFAQYCILIATPITRGFPMNTL
ncbi:MAG: hypothetical protein U1B80_00360, partial [Anaerolineaceae bacterium]|nr:hypothetical protein [Anaerolineaceae bacterium]